MFKSFLQKILRHKIISCFIILVLIGVGYYLYGKFFTNNTANTYITANVKKGTLVVSVSGSGQVSALDQVNLNAKVSGDVVYIGVEKGHDVLAGRLIVQIDSRDAERSVRDAEVSLAQAKLEFEKMKGMITSEGTIRGVKEKAKNDLDKAYDDGFNNISNAFLDFPDIVTGLYNLLFSATLDRTQWNIDYYAGAAKLYDERAQQYRNDVSLKYQEARSKYDKTFSDYKNASRYSDDATIENLINETYDTAKSLAEATKSASNLIQFYKDTLIAKSISPVSSADTHLSVLNTYTSKTNTYLLNLLSVKNTILTDKETLINTDFDISDQEIKVTQAENSLLTAKEKLADYFIHAPFNGIVAEVNVKKGDSVSSGVIATLITKQRVAEISLNEVDVAKIKINQKVNLTFDALEDLSIVGKVAEIDTIGTVTQGVVTYNVKIIFDTQDERVKPGMSVSATIITDLKQDILIIPISAIKNNGEQYVVVLENNISHDQIVETGISNDTETEIISGLKEGDQVVTQTTTTSTKNSTSNVSRGGGGFMMMGH